MSAPALAIPTAIEEATAHQPRARIALASALASGPSHAYLFDGPRGSGKRRAARAFAAEILASGADDPDDARRRALLRPSPHPDLVWIEPPGTQHLVENVREHVIRGAAYRPFEGSRRVFVIDAAEALRDESQNALLKTLEEPASFAHLILVSSDPGAVLPTIVSRCQPVRFSPLPPEAVADTLEGPPAEVRAAALLSAGDADRAAFLIEPAGRELRLCVEGCVRAARARTVGAAPWRALLAAAEQAGEIAAAEVEQRLAAQLESLPGGGREAKRVEREHRDQAKRTARLRRTEALQLALDLCILWLRDLAAVAHGAEALVAHADRIEVLREDTAGLDPRRAHRAVELVADTRTRLDLNVSEELALEALFYRLEELIA